MSQNINEVKATVAVEGIESICNVEDIKSFLDFLVTNLSITLPDNVGPIVISTTAPGDDEKSKVWIRRAGDGSFQGIFLYQQGAWRQIFPVEDEMIKIFRKSLIANSDDNVPFGYRRVDANNPKFTSTQANYFVQQYLKDSTQLYYEWFYVTKG